MGIYTLRKAFLVHGQGIYLKAADPILDHGEKLFIIPPLKIADGYIRMRAFSGIHDFNGKLWITDPAADEGSIKYQGFYKSIP